MLATAEIAWTPLEQRKQDDFLRRLQADQCRRLSLLGLGAPTTQPSADVEKELSGRFGSATTQP
jgi:hypothetical protein